MKIISKLIITGFLHTLSHCILQSSSTNKLSSYSANGNSEGQSVSGLAKEYAKSM
jgi:hypothetical protein